MLRRVEGTPLSLGDEQPLLSDEEILDFDEIVAEDLAPIPVFASPAVPQPLVAKGPLSGSVEEPITTLSA